MARLDQTPKTVSIVDLIHDGRGVARWPIGQVDMIKAATSERLRRFYRANYRPDNATIIVVGNVDPVAVEKQIKAQRWYHRKDPNLTTRKAWLLAQMADCQNGLQMIIANRSPVGA